MVSSHWRRFKLHLRVTMPLLSPICKIVQPASCGLNRASSVRATCSEWLIPIHIHGVWFHEPERLDNMTPIMEISRALCTLWLLAGVLRCTEAAIIETSQTSERRKLVRTFSNMSARTCRRFVVIGEAPIQGHSALERPRIGTSPVEKHGVTVSFT